MINGFATWDLRFNLQKSHLIHFLSLLFFLCLNALVDSVLLSMSAAFLVICSLSMRFTRFKQKKKKVTIYLKPANRMPNRKTQNEFIRKAFEYLKMKNFILGLIKHNLFDPFKLGQSIGMLLSSAPNGSCAKWDWLKAIQNALLSAY